MSAAFLIRACFRYLHRVRTVVADGQLTSESVVGEVAEAAGHTRGRSDDAVDCSPAGPLEGEDVENQLAGANATHVVEVTKELRLSPEDTKDLVFREAFSTEWLGAPANLPFRVKSTAWMLDQGQNRRYGRVTHAIQEAGVYTWTVSWSAQYWPGASLSVQIGPGTPPNSSSIRIAEQGLKSPGAASDWLHFWQEALNRLERVASSVRARRNNPRQALVVVHGIGEQLPGKTMMELVSAVFPESGGDNFSTRWVRPDAVSATFELRRVTIEATPRTKGLGADSPSHANRPTTDVFEMYWAHLMRDTTLAQVLDWMVWLLLRPWTHVPRALLAHFIVIWLCVGIAVVLVALSAFGVFSTQLVLGVAAIAILGLALRAAGRVVTKTAIGYIGDAARYLRPKPDNIARRQEIREAGVRLLQELQGSGKYDRIVLLGHSLGSVIAYDILSYAWIRSHLDHLGAARPKSSALSVVEEAIGKKLDSSLAQELQFEAWKEHRANTQPWLITDLVTVGSPLTYADFLIADNKGDFRQLKTQRILSTCPPTPELKNGHPLIRRTQTYRLVDGRNRTIHSPDYGSVFAVTRWTNLYFPFTGMVKGDPVGGPVSQLFGSWIVDVEVERPRGGFLGFAHTSYWKSMPNGSGECEHVEQLKKALRLNITNELLDLARQRPAFSYNQAKAKSPAPLSRM